jgi:hypothetical protein
VPELIIGKRWASDRGKSVFDLPTSRRAMQDLSIEVYRLGNQAEFVEALDGLGPNQQWTIPRCCSTIDVVPRGPDR